jgi:hypothetical protein
LSRSVIISARARGSASTLRSSVSKRRSWSASLASDLVETQIDGIQTPLYRVEPLINIGELAMHLELNVA